MKRILTSLMILCSCTMLFSQTPMSNCKGKYLGNIVAGNSVRSDYNTLWNAVTSENDCKWGTIERTRNQMNWRGADMAYNYAKQNGMEFRWHALAWGSQYPTWIEGLSPQDFRNELEEYMRLVSERYPDIDQIDVVNEALRTHAPGTPLFRNALGGANDGVAPDRGTGFDWIVWCFRKARQYFPNAKLILNDYGLENDQPAIREMLQIVAVLRQRDLIDGFGTQAHEFNINTLSAAQLRSSLDLMATGGVPIYVTELDISGDDNTQRERYERLFPVYWEHPNVAGISLWGYVMGQTWIDNTGLIRTNGTDRPAMTWLKSYMAARPNVGYPYCGNDNGGGTIGQNLLTNGEFDNSTLMWELQNNSTGNGSMSVVQNANMSGANALSVCVSNPGTEDWHVQVRQNAPFVAGRHYEISFIAKAEAARNMTVSLQQEGDPWTTHFGQQVNLTTANQTFAFAFSPTVSDATAKLKFYVGGNASCVFIDNVVFKQVEATEPPAEITAVGNTTFCAGGSVVLNANTGTGYTYQWRRNGTNIPNATTATHTATEAGNYTVIVTSTGLSTTSSAVNVVVNALPVITMYANNNNSTWNQLSSIEVCEDDQLIIGPQPTINTGWSWSGTNGYTATSREITLNQITLNQAGIYTATYTDQAGCVATSDFIISVNAKTAWYEDADDDGFGDLNSVIMACDQPTGYVDNDLDECPNDANKQEPGMCGCGIAEDDCITGMVNAKNNTMFEMWPNPFQDELLVNLHTAETAKMRILNVNGVLMREQTINGTAIIGNELPVGTYFIYLETNTGVSVHKVVKHE